MDFSAVFDVKMLDGLLRSLGKDQLIELLDGFIQKTDEIVAALMAASEKGDNVAAHESAHELRGMAANFGMKELAAIAAVIKKKRCIITSRKRRCLRSRNCQRPRSGPKRRSGHG